METPLNTTLGSCAVCNRRPASGSGFFVGGALALAVGLVIAILAYRFRGADLVSGAACAVAMLAGGVLLSMGLFRGVRSVTPKFLSGSLALSPTSVSPGSSVSAKVQLAPDHTLHLRAATVELQAVERLDSDEKVLRTVEQPLSLVPHFREDVEREVTVTIPAGWPATMDSPPSVSPARHVLTRVRVAIDADAHPLFVLEAPVTIG